MKRQVNDMERLTAIAPSGMAYLINVKPNEQDVESPHPNTLRCIMDSFNKLAEYEETGRTPDEITNLCDSHSNLLKYVIKKTEIKRERDYWEREAKKWCNQLGSLRKWLDDNDLDMDDILRKVAK